MKAIEKLLDKEDKGKWYFRPLLLSISIVLLDQITKLLVLKYIPYIYSQPDSIVRIIGDFLWFINVSNNGAMFSFGADFSGFLRGFVLFVLPILLLCYMTILVLHSNLERELRWILAGILGGGFGNIIDRFFRADGVVDFISVNIYGAFGMERWPTFNVADSAIVVSMIFWLLTLFFPKVFLGTKEVSKVALTEASSEVAPENKK